METDSIKKEIAPVISNAGAMTISSPETYDGAIGFLKEIKSAQKRVADFFEPMKKAASAAHKAVCNAENEVLVPLAVAERELKAKAITYHTAQEKIRQEAERKAQAEADERARKEREKLEKEAAKLKTPEKIAAKLEQAAAIVAPIVSVASVVEKQSGVVTKKIWKARVIDKALVPREWMVVDESKLNAFAKGTKGEIAVPGVEFYCEQSLAIGAGR